MKSVTNKIAKVFKEMDLDPTIEDNTIYLNLLVEDIGITINFIISNSKIKDDMFRLDFVVGPITHVVNYDNMIKKIHDLNRETMITYFSINKNNDIVAIYHNLSREETISEDAGFLFLVIYRQIIETYPTLMKVNWQ